MEWAFGDCVLSEELVQLTKAGRVVRLEPKVFYVLRFLIENRERVLSKAEILDEVWPGEAVSESVLPRSIAMIRRAVGDTRANQHVVETVHGHGYRFVAAVVPQGRGRPSAAVASELRHDDGRDFVGREDVLQRIAQAFDETLDGRGRVVLLVGEPGIGKTRTVERSLEQMGGGARAYTGACFEREGAPPYWPFVQILRSLVDDLDASDLLDWVRPTDADLIPLVPVLLDLCPDLSASDPFEGEQARFRLFDSVASFLRRIANRHPLVLVVEDLHWADRDSMLLTSFLATVLRDAPVLLLGTIRDREVGRDQSLEALQRDLSRAPHCERIVLRGLAPKDVTRLLRELGRDELDGATNEMIVEMAEGNPFFVRELAAIANEGGPFDLGDRERSSLDLSQGVRDTVGLRLASLSSACTDLLSSASVLGREFNVRVLLDLSGGSNEETLELLGEALAAGLLTEHSTAGRFAFSHALVRQVLYDALGLPRRVVAHREAASALERIYGDESSDHLSEVAFHLFEGAVGGDPLRSVEVSVRAAELARRKCAYDESVRHLERALEAFDLAEHSEPLRRCELILLQAEAKWDAGQRDDAHDQFRRAADLARELGRPDLLARAAVGMRSYGDNTRPDPETVRLLEEALEAVGAASPVWRARILSRLTYCDPHTREMSNRARLAGEAADLTTESEDPAVLFDVFVGRYWSTLGPDALGERITVGREAAEAGRRLGDPRLELLGHDTLVGAHLVLGEFAEVGRQIEAFGEIARTLRQPVFEFHGLILQIVYAMNCGRFAEAEVLLARATERGAGFVQDAEALAGGIRFWLRDMRGETTDPSEAQGILQDVGSRLLSSTGTDQIVKASIIEVCLAVGQPDVARVQLHELFENEIEALSRNENWLITMSLAGSAAVALDEPEIAERLYRLLTPYESLMFVHDHLHVNRGSVASSLGALAGIIGRHEESVDRLRAAIGREEAIGAAPAALDTRILLVQQLARMGRGEAAQRELETAQRVGEGFGSRRLYRVFSSLEG